MQNISSSNFVVLFCFVLLKSAIKIVTHSMQKCQQFLHETVSILFLSLSLSSLSRHLHEMTQLEKQKTTTKKEREQLYK